MSIASNAYYGELYLSYNHFQLPNEIVADICAGASRCGTPELASYIVPGGSMPSTLTSVGTYSWDGTNGGYYLYAGSDYFLLTAESVQIGETPLPATAPLFATGLGVMGLFGWRSRRKAEAMT